MSLLQGEEKKNKVSYKYIIHNYIIIKVSARGIQKNTETRGQTHVREEK